MPQWEAFKSGSEGPAHVRQSEVSLEGETCQALRRTQGKQRRARLGGEGLSI